MKIEEMVAKFSNIGGNVASKSLSKITSGSSENDFVTDGLFARIVEASQRGYYQTNMSENAVYVIMEVCTKGKAGKFTPTGEAVQVYLSMFDRVAVPYTIDAEGFAVRDPQDCTIRRASGSVVDTWKRAANAEEFMKANLNKVMQFNLNETIKVRAWDRANKTFSTTELRDQKIYKIEWVG
jgi:hypothetical protein